MRTLIRVSAIVVLVVLTNLVTDGFRDSVRADHDPDECVTGDVTGDGHANLVDALYLLRYLFTNGPDLVACAGDGESQLTDDEVALVQALAEHMSVIDVEDPNDDEITYKTIRFEEVNVQIVNGLGATNGYPDALYSSDEEDIEVNGLGNLIVGYNLPEGGISPLQDNLRTGSHNIVVGTHNDYSSFGGIVVGLQNTTSGAWSSVIGGAGNEASGDFASVSGGVGNEASGPYSSVSGGVLNDSSGIYSTVSGGGGNIASGYASTISGGGGIPFGLEADDDYECIDPDTD